MPSQPENLSYLVSKIGSRTKGSDETKKKRVTRLTKPIESDVAPTYDDDIAVSKFFDSSSKTTFKKKIKKNVDKEKHQETLQKAMFGPGFQDTYSDTVPGPKPLIDYYSVLIPRNPKYQEEQNFLSKSKLKLLMPITVVYGVDEYPVMYFTDNDGFVRRIDNVTTPQIIKRLTHGAGPEDLIVVQKNPLTGESITNNAILLNSKQLKTTLENQSRGKVVFQQFIKSKGPKATITRVCWRRDSPSYAYMLSNKRSFDDPTIKEAVFRMLTTTEEPQTLNVFKLKAPAIKDLEAQVSAFVEFSERYSKPKVRFSEFVCDFIRGEDGNWYFIQVKGFKVVKKPKTATGEVYDADAAIRKSKKSKANYMKLKECKMCLNLYPPSDLMYQMTLKMIYATESHLKQRAVKLPWFDRPEFNSITDTSMWYEPHPVCKNCFDMYIQEQKLSKVEVEFAKAIGIPVNEKANENASILTTLSGKLNTSRKSKSRPGTAQVVEKVPKKLHMYRFITYINELRNIPDVVPDRFSLRMKIFKKELIIPLKIESPMERRVLPVGKLRVYYFFVPDDEAYRKWLHDYENVTVNLFAGDERLGFANLVLSQFGSGLIDKLDYMVLFSSQKLQLCSLRATLGFVKMEPMDLSNVPLESWGGVYVPPDDFFTAHPLPDEWMEVIPQLSGQLPIDKLAKMDPTLRQSKGQIDLSRSSTKSRPATAPVAGRQEVEAKSPDEILELELSKTSASIRSQRLKLRSVKKKPKRSSLPYGHSKLALTPKAAGARTLPISKVYSPIYSSRLGTPSKRYRDRLFQNYGRPPTQGSAKPYDGTISGQTSPTKELVGDEKKRVRKATPSQEVSAETATHHVAPGKPPKVFNTDEYVWSFNIRIGSVYDLEAKVDDPWLMTFDLFQGLLHREFESFQLIEHGPLIFDVDNTFYFTATETNLMNYFGKERVFKLILHQKYSKEEEFTAAIDLRQFQKADNIEVVAQIERIKADEVDNTRFMEAQSDDDEFMDEEDDGEDKHDGGGDEKENHATVKVFMVINKKGLIMEYEDDYTDLPVKGLLQEYDVKLIDGVPKKI